MQRWEYFKARGRTYAVPYCHPSRPVEGWVKDRKGLRPMRTKPRYMRLTQTLITEDEARRRAPDLVAVIEEEVVALLEALGDLEAELVAERTKATEALALVETLRLPKVE